MKWQGDGPPQKLPPGKGDDLYDSDNEGPPIVDKTQENLMRMAAEKSLEKKNSIEKLKNLTLLKESRSQGSGGETLK